MEIEKWTAMITSWIKKYRYPILIIIIGLVILTIPEKKKAESKTVETNVVLQKDMNQQLCEILSKIDGVGRVEVMLTVLSGETTYYLRDESINGSDATSSVRQETVIITDSDRNQHPLITQVIPPKYQGAVIVCQGADRAEVKLAIVEAVSKATGLGADQISVLKMK